METRGYHSTAVLLPDGRVLYGGSNAPRTYDYQIYRPPYVDKVRPVITGGPGTVSTNQVVQIDYLYEGSSEFSTVERAALIRPGSTTHHFDSEQRYILLEPEPSQPGKLSVRTPSSFNEAPRGWYMLVIRTSDRIPSKAVWVNLQ